MNGVDTLSYLNIDTTTIIPFTAIDNPSAPTVANNGSTDLTTGTASFTLYYRITANSTVGESAASNATSKAVNTDRDFWDPSVNSLKITWSAVTNAQSYNVYMGTVSGFEYLIASGVGGTTFIDDGSAVQDNTRLYPTTNSTAGMKATRGANIGGRAFLAGDPDHPYYIWNGGDAGNELDFSPANGGGFSLVNSGGKELPQVVKLHRDGKGTATIKVYCTGTYGKRFSLIPDTITFGSTVIPFYDVVEDEGLIGTNAPDAILYYNNSMWYPSSEGFQTDGTLPQIQNVLATKKASNTIESDMSKLNQAAMDKACGMEYYGRLLYALPVNSSSNNEVWTLDLDRDGPWMEPWNISADWMWQTTDNTGNLHHLVLSNNHIFDLTYSVLTADDGEPFITRGKSGQIYFSDDKQMWVQLLQAVIILLQPQGETNWTITGRTEDEEVAGLGEPVSYNPTNVQSPAGWGEVNTRITGWGRNGWSKVNLVPTVTSAVSKEILIPIDEEVQWASYSWFTNKPGVDYNISDIVFEYVETGIKNLS